MEQPEDKDPLPRKEVGLVDAEFNRRLLADPPGMLLVSHPDILVGIGGMCGAALIAEDMGVLILGLDGFRTDGEHLIPLIEYILDSSCLCTPDLVWESAVKKSVGAVEWVADLWKDGPEFVEFVLLGKDEDPHWFQRLMSNFSTPPEASPVKPAMSGLAQRPHLTVGPSKETERFFTLKPPSALGGLLRTNRRNP